MKKKSLLAMCLFCLFSITRAQNEFEVTNMGGGGFTIGYGNMNVSSLHTFAPASVRSFSNNQTLVGGTGHGFIGRLVLGGGGFGITGDRFTTDSLQGGISGGLGTFDFGYTVVNKNKLKVFPMIGIGGGGYGIHLTKTGNLTSANVVDNPGREISISQGGLVADFSINIYTIPALVYDQVENSYGGFMIGLKMGYVYSVPGYVWSYSGGDITDGPRFGLNMPYVKLVIGGFGYSKNPD